MRKKTVKIDGRVITFFEEGKGPPIILLPGLGSDCSGWEKVVSNLKSHYKIYAFSLPLYGTHNQFGRRYTYLTFPDLLERLIKEFKIRKPVLVGHSLGAVVSVEYNARHPQSVSKLVLVSAPFTDHSKPIPPLWHIGVDFALKSKQTQEIMDWLAQNRELVDLILGIIFPKRDTQRMQNAGQEMLKNMPVKSMALCFKHTFDLSFRKDLEKVKIPTLFVYGTEDTAIAMINGTALYQTVKGAKIVSLPTSHFIPADEPDILSDLILKFLA